MVNHIGVVIDGNRRWAKVRDLKPWKGHEEGAKRVEELIQWVTELKIKELTIYSLSIENLKRDKIELDFLFKLFKIWFEKIRKDKRIENKIKLRFIGDLNLVPKDIKEMALKTEEMTKNNDNYTVNFCFAYGGKQEIIEAIKKLVKSKEEINEENLSKNLWLKSEPDFIIRTGNRIRTSNFLPWQAAYSEWFFLDKLWPDFSKQDLISCIDKFNNIQRNFGR